MDTNGICVRRLVRNNVIGAVVIAITCIAVKTLESSLLIFGAFCLVLGFVGLGVVNVVATFRLWKSYRQRALVPLTTYICCTVALVAGTHYGISAVLSGTPQQPDTFPRGKVKAELEHIAAQLLGHSFKTIFTRSDATLPVRMVAGSAPEAIPADLLRRLRSYGFDSIFIDDAQSLVVFSSNHFRSWYHYLYTTTGALAPAYSRQSTITDVDIETWAELSRIARQGPEMTADAQGGIVFEPTVVYPTLRQALGEDQLNALGETVVFTITPEQKARVLNALNDQRLVSSRLVEHSSITIGDTERFHLSVGCPISDGFWVSKLVQTLLRNGTLQRAEDNRHLRMKKGLTELEERQVEWVHVGLMNFLYGNLFEKRDLHYSRELGDGWYFERD